MWQAKFSLPLNDPKKKHCKAFNRVEVWDNDEYIGLFRIIPSLTKKDVSNNSIEYQLEHVLSTLMDDVLFQYHQLTNYTTTVSLQYIIDRQETKHWKLGRVDFTRYFHYKWENENLLSALFSVPNPFDVQYQWTWDTQTYPWTLNLVAPEDNVTCEIREGKNLTGFEIEERPDIFNRIYPLGFGEGVNQLNIKKVNNGIPYVEDTASIAKYGLRKYIWVDRRSEKADSLKASGLALLKSWKEPIVTWRASAADLSSITGLSKDKFKMGRIIRVITNDFGIVELRIEKESKGDVTGNPGGVELELGNKSEDISTTHSDLERRQQINELYAQGATNLDSHDYTDNADPQNPAVIRFFLPEELVRINKMTLSYETSEFRAYSRATKGGGARVGTTSSGGATVKSTSSGGGSTQTASSGGGGTHTSSSGGGGVRSSSISNPTFFAYTGNPVEMNPTVDQHIHAIEVTDQMNHNHTVDIPDHSHSVSIPNHSHSVNIPNHSHEIDIPSHTHTITLPDHTHEIDYGIFKLSDTPTSVVIKVDGNTVPITATSGDQIDIIPYLDKDTEGRINRGRWVEVEITPNKLGRINASIISQLFLQSVGGGDF